MTPSAIVGRLGSRWGVVALWLAATIAYALITLMMGWGGVTGWDAAAHLYKTSLIRDGQSIFWDNYWYGGSHGVITYGFVYYWLARHVPAGLIVVMAAGAIPPLFLIYQREMWGLDDIWPAVALAVGMGMYLAHGQDPFVLALALSLAGMALLATGRSVLAALPVGVGVFVNPMGLVVIGVLVLADVAARPPLRRRYITFLAALTPVVAARLVLGWAFSEPGSYLNETSQLLVYLGFALAGVALAGVNAAHPRRPFVILFLIYAAACLVSFIVPDSPLGSNIGRFFLVFGLPLMVLLRHSRLRRPFPYGELAVIPIALFGLLQFSTPWDHYFGGDQLRQTRAEFFAPALAVAAQRHDPGQRVHVVALRRHWEAAYFPQAGLPITRGWYRQADAVHNSLFYTSYDEAGYVAWLRHMGVEYIFLPDAPLDQWSEREARILRRSTHFLKVEQAGSWTIYRLRRPGSMVTALDGGSATMVSLGHDAFAVRVDRPGAYLIRVTWTPYWTLEGAGRLAPGADRFIRLEAERAGVYSASIAVTLQKVLTEAEAVLGGSPWQALEGKRTGTLAI